MNKLAVLALSLLIFFSTMLWYLANGSLNEYLKSQTELQGHYYSGQKTSLALADFSSNTGTATFSQLSLANQAQYQSKNVLIIDEIKAVLSNQQSKQPSTVSAKVTINKLILNIEQLKAVESNIEQIKQRISLQLANDYPQLYPHISAAIYAKNNPELNADQYSKNNPQSGPIIEHTQKAKKRGKAQQKIIISAIDINTLEINTLKNGSKNTIQKHNVSIERIGEQEGLLVNQIGGEFLLHLLQLVH